MVLMENCLRRLITSGRRSILQAQGHQDTRNPGTRTFQGQVTSIDVVGSYSSVCVAVQDRGPYALSVVGPRKVP